MNALAKIFKETDIRLRASALFAIAAFLISLITGLISGVGIGIVLVRVFFALIVFALIGYLSCSAIMKYAPEFFDILRSDGGYEKSHFEESKANSSDESEAASEQTGTNSPESTGFTEFDASSFPKINLSGSGNGSESFSVNPEKDKVAGDSEYEFNYQPELMAEAVRTMMKKDGD